MANFLLYLTIFAYCFYLALSMNSYINSRFTTRGDTKGYCHVAIPGGGFYLTGFVRQYLWGSSDVLLVKTDANGSQMWLATFNIKEKNVGRSLVITKNNNVMITGNADNYTFVLRADSNGNLIFTKKFDKMTFARSIIRTRDNKYVIAGNYIDDDVSKVWIMKIDDDGDEIWTRKYGGKKGESANCIIQTNDDGFAAVGYTQTYGAGKKDIWLLKLDEKGNMDWSQTYGEEYDDEGNSVIQLDSDDFIIHGYTIEIDGIVLCKKPWAIQTNYKGHQRWESKLDGGCPFWYEGNDVKKTADNGTIYTAFWDGTIGDNALVYRLGPTFEFYWSSEYKIGSRGTAFSIIEEQDGRVTFAGTTLDVNKNDMAAWLVSPYCGGGTFVDKEECKLCPNGTYSPKGHGFECILCEKGTFNPKWGMTECLQCPKNMTSERGATQCKPKKPEDEPDENNNAWIWIIIILGGFVTIPFIIFGLTKCFLKICDKRHQNQPEQKQNLIPEVAIIPTPNEDGFNNVATEQPYEGRIDGNSLLIKKQ